MIAESIDLACWPLFYAMSRRGIRVDSAKMEVLLADVRSQMAAISLPFNPASSDEVAAWMDAQGFTGKRTRKTHRLATGKKVLATYDHPVLKEVVRYRELQKIEGTFIKPVLYLAAKHNGIIHPRWRLTKVKSGRIACGSDETKKNREPDPNLLAFPARTELGRRVRDCFIPRDGFKFVSVDFSQIEPRMSAALSRDKNLLSVYENDGDVYVDVRERLGITRPEAKVVVLAVFYGTSDYTLSEQLGSEWDPDACSELIARQFTVYPGVRKLIDDTLNKARQAGGWAYTHFGRGRYLPALFLPGDRWPNAKLREEAERQAFNHLIQGSAQEQMKMAQLRVARQVPDAHAILQIHDELVNEVPEAHAEAVAQQQADVMATVFEGVALKTEWKVGDSWGAVK